MTKGAVAVVVVVVVGFIFLLDYNINLNPRPLGTLFKNGSQLVLCVGKCEPLNEQLVQFGLGRTGVTARSCHVCLFVCWVSESERIFQKTEWIET